MKLSIARVGRQGRRRSRAAAGVVIFSALLFALGLGGCATVPRQSVELSEVVDRQIAEMQKSHEAFVSLYYVKLREDIDRFIEEKWTPNFLEETLAGKDAQSKQLLHDLSVSYKMINLDPSAVSVSVDGKQVTDPDVKTAIEQGVSQAITEQRARFGKTMLKYSRGAQRQVSKKRAELIEPVDEQERLVLTELRDGYADLTRASIAIKGYLASVVKITEERDQILGKLGVLEKQRKLVDYAVEANEKTVAALDKAEDADAAIDKFKEGMGEARMKMDAIREKYADLKTKLKD